MPPLLTIGFRPFFLAAGVWSVLGMALWLPLFGGEVSLPTRFDPVSWHIHEMLFGFIMAAAAGFLLTAIANWTNRPPVAGWPLLLLVALWLLGRIVCLVSAWLPAMLAPIIDPGFAIALAMVAARELFAAGNRRNYPLLVPLLVLAVANLLMHLQTLDLIADPGLGWRLAIALVIVLISVIGGRIVPAFTRNWLLARDVARPPVASPTLNRLALATLHTSMLAWTFLPDWPPLGILLVIAAALNALRLACWRGIDVSEEPILLILHIGYLWLSVGVGLLGLSLLTVSVPLAAALHALTAGAMGTMVLAVMTRATRGHTGRALHSGAATNAAYVLVTVAAVLRVVAAWGWFDQMILLHTAAFAWIAAFALFIGEYAPMLLAARR